jgi:hypothetical protein
MEKLEIIYQRESQLRDILARLVVESDLEKLLNLILKDSVKLLNMESAGIILYHKGTPDKFSYSAAVNIPIPYTQRIIEEKDGLLSQVILQKKPIVLQHFSGDTSFGKIWFDLGARTVIGAPVVFRDELIGIIHLSSTDNQREIDTFEKESLQIYAEYAGIAIHNAQMLAELKKHRGHLEELIEERTAELEKTNAKLQQEITERKRTEEALCESQERYRALVENTVLGITVIDTNYKIIMANAMLSKLFNKPASDFVGKNCFREYEKREAVCPHCPGVRAMASGNTVEVETQGVRDDGSRFYVRNRAVPLIGLDGVVKGFIEMVEDIDVRKRTEEALRTSKSKYRTLLENLPQKIFYKDRNSVYVSCNDNYAQDLKIKSDEIIGKTDYDFYPKELAEKYTADDKRIMESGKTEEIEEKYIQEGKEGIVHTVKTPIKDEKGTVIGILGIFWDITERKKAEEALKNYTRQIEKVNKELDDFTYIVSHDLKEPLRSIDAFSKFIEEDYKDKLDEQGRDYIKRIRVNASRMQNLIEDLLEISRIERKRGSFEEVEAEELVNEVNLWLEYAIKQKDVEIIVRDKLPMIFCDRIRLTEVFLNLISNAIKFNDKPNPRVEVGCSQKGIFYEFYIKDNGPGIEEQYFDKIFEIFQRLGKSEEHEGTGAGLTIAKKIVQMHRGKIWVESKVGEGSTFYFTIPKGKEAILGKKKIGEILVEKNLVTEEEVKKALEEQERRGE